MKLWLDININTHTFIATNYWVENFELVREMMLEADVYVYRASGEITAFVGLVDTYVAGVFVSSENRSMGIARELLDYIKTRYNKLTLTVYEKNVRAINFYLRENFINKSKQIDEDTGQIEFLMQWEQ